MEIFNKESNTNILKKDAFVLHLTYGEMSLFLNALDAYRYSTDKSYAHLQRAEELYQQALSCYIENIS